MKTIAITIGDVNGIGPEVALLAAQPKHLPKNTRAVLVGSAAAISQQAKALHLRTPPKIDQLGRGTQLPKVSIWDPTPKQHISLTPGRITAKASRLAVDWIKAAVQGCQQDCFDAMVTAPICKEGLHKAGINFPGHTELIAKLTKTKHFAMLLVGGPLRVILVTRHIPLGQVANSITKQNILETIKMAAKALPWLGCRKANIGVCALNPHGGDGGAIGKEEQSIIKPAIQAALRHGIKVKGPIPADVIFHEAYSSDTYAIVVALYHDQGLGPLKTVAFDHGVNITLGLPIIRTSPDHGTAMDIAGRGKANFNSMKEAILLAHRLSLKTNPWIDPKQH